MRTPIQNLFLVLACTGLLAMPAAAQTFTNLHSFTAMSGLTNSDGANPYAGLTLSGNTLYGTAAYGGSFCVGTVFAVNTDGTGFTNLHSFAAMIDTFPSPSPSGWTNSDGACPFAGLILSGNTLYGTAYGGGSSDNGTVFAVNTDGTGFTNLHSFTASSYEEYPYTNINSDGAFPDAGLILSGNTLYGTASRGGNSDNGTVFALNTDGTGFTTLHSFTALSNSTNSDGAYPCAGLILSGNTLYGTAVRGGISGNGTVFALNIDGTGFTTLHSFTGGSDGAFPDSGLILSGNTLYGTALDGGISGNGTVFALNTDGTGFTNLYSFTALSNSTNSDGAYPCAGLILSGNTLYGTAGGGSFGNGTVFALNTDGTGFTTLHNFAGYPSDGTNPQAGLILSGNTLYGTTCGIMIFGGGSPGLGTVFSLTVPPPPLTIIHSATNVILTWPTYAPGVTLQSTTNLVSPVVWSTNSPAPTIVNGQNAVTNPVSGTQQFYRLSQ